MSDLFVIAGVETGKLNALVKNIMAQIGITDPNEAIRLVNSGEWVLVAKEATPEPVIDPIIRVNRAVQPAYPDWVQKVMHPDLQVTGPAEYGIDRVQQWLHPDQESGITTGNVIYGHLKDTDNLKDQLGLADLLAIQAKGIGFFRTHFAGKAVFGWKSVVQSRDGRLSVPYLFGNGDGVVVHWGWLDDSFGSSSPGLRFASI